MFLLLHTMGLWDTCTYMFLCYENEDFKLVTPSFNICLGRFNENVRKLFNSLQAQILQLTT